MIDNKIIDRVGYTALILAIGMLLYPFMIAGFFFDDIYNSVTKGYLIANDVSLWEYTKSQMYMWVIDNGRLFPLSIIMGMWSWYYFDTLLLARSYQVVMALVNILLWFALIYKITANNRLAILNILLLSCVVQFNPRWDGLSSFNALNQNVVSFILLSALCLISAIASASNRRLLFTTSLFSTSCALLTYEVGVLSIVLNLMLLYCYRDKDFSLRKVLSYFIFLGIIYIALNLYLRAGRSANYDGIELEFGYKIFLTFFNQFMSAFPFAYVGNEVMSTTQIKYGIALMCFILFLVAIYPVLRMKKKDNFFDARKRAVALKFLGFDLHILLSLIFLILPAALISLSARYQSIVKYGDPYIVVYVQYFGSSLLLAILIDRLIDVLDSAVVASVLSVFLALVASVTVSVNYERIGNQNKKFKETRIASEELLKTSFMSNLSDGATLLVDSPLIWESQGVAPSNLCSSFFSQHLNRKIYCTEVNNFSIDKFNKRNDLQDVFFLKSFDIKEKHVWELQGRGVRKYAEYSRNKLSPVILSEQSKGIIFHQLNDGFYGWEIASGGSFAWSKGSARISIFKLYDDIDVNAIEFELMSAVDQLLVIKINNIEYASKRFNSGESIKVALNHPLKYGENVLSINANGPVMRVSGDPRTFSFYVKNLEINKRVESNGNKLYE